MALILKYRLEPPEAFNKEVWDFLVKQVGEVGLNIQIPLGESGGHLALVGQFISVEGEHFEQREVIEDRKAAGPVLVEEDGMRTSGKPRS